MATATTSRFAPILKVSIWVCMPFANGCTEIIISNTDPIPHARAVWDALQASGATMLCLRP